MRKTIPPALYLLFALVSPAAAQSVSFTGEGRVENTVTMSPTSLLVPTLCTANSTTLCLNGSRFRASIIFSAPTLGIMNAPAQAVPLTSDTGYFWFFSANNVEIVLKVVDGRAFNGFFWVFEGALSDVEYTITVVDTQTGATRTYHNTAGHLASFADTAAFGGGTTCDYLVSPLSQSFTGSGGTGSLTVTAGVGCTWSATSNASFITITSGASGNGTGTISYSVAPNPSLVSRTGTLTVAGQIVTINQGGGSGGGGPYDGIWTGTNSLTCQPSSGPTGPCGMNWTISNSRLLRFEIHYSGTACGVVDGGTIFNYTAPGLDIDPAAFSLTSSGGSPVRADLNVNVTKATTSSATVTGTVTLMTMAPLPSCTTTLQFTGTATKN
jgi:Putative binding domain, N-terminal